MAQPHQKRPAVDQPDRTPRLGTGGCSPLYMLSRDERQMGVPLTREMQDWALDARSGHLFLFTPEVGLMQFDEELRPQKPPLYEAHVRLQDYLHVSYPVSSSQPKRVPVIVPGRIQCMAANSAADLVVLVFAAQDEMPDSYTLVMLRGCWTQKWQASKLELQRTTQLHHCTIRNILVANDGWLALDTQSLSEDFVPGSLLQIVRILDDGPRVFREGRDFAWLTDNGDADDWRHYAVSRNTLFTLQRTYEALVMWVSEDPHMKVVGREPQRWHQQPPPAAPLVEREDFRYKCSMCVDAARNVYLYRDLLAPQVQVLMADNSSGIKTIEVPEGRFFDPEAGVRRMAVDNQCTRMLLQHQTTVQRRPIVKGADDDDDDSSSDDESSASAAPPEKLIGAQKHPRADPRDAAYSSLSELICAKLARIPTLMPDVSMDSPSGSPGGDGAAGFVVRLAPGKQVLIRQLTYRQLFQLHQSSDSSARVMELAKLYGRITNQEFYHVSNDFKIRRLEQCSLWYAAETLVKGKSRYIGLTQLMMHPYAPVMPREPRNRPTELEPRDGLEVVALMTESGSGVEGVGKVLLLVAKLVALRYGAVRVNLHALDAPVTYYLEQGFHTTGTETAEHMLLFEKGRRSTRVQTQEEYDRLKRFRPKSLIDPDELTSMTAPVQSLELQEQWNVHMRAGNTSLFSLPADLQPNMPMRPDLVPSVAGKLRRSDEDLCQHCLVKPVVLICVHDTGEGFFCSEECSERACPHHSSDEEV